MMRALGLMSGTSMDGIDVAVIETDGERRVDFGPCASFSYQAEERAAFREALAQARDLRDRDARPAAVRRAEGIVTAHHIAAVESFFQAQTMSASDIDIIGFHGQTVLHRPEERLTIQIGDGTALAEHFGVAVAWDFRAADVAAGGQGAPLVPIYHHALVDRDGIDRPVAVINIGGVANLTMVAPGRDPIAFDTGPGNALLDDLVLERTGQAFDRDGALALAGRVDAAALATLLAHPFFALPAPKSLDRNGFSRAPVARLTTEDAAATLAAFTAASIALAVDALPVRPDHAIVCGGGARNLRIMRELGERLACRLSSADDEGWSVDAMEAQAFAYLAVRCEKILPITFPSTTGVSAPLAGGRISRSATSARRRAG